MFRTNVDEMNVEPIDLGNELRQGVQFRLGLAPVVIGRPIAREFLRRRELHALRLISDVFPLRPLRRVDAPAEVVERLLWDVDAEGADCGWVGGPPSVRWVQGGFLAHRADCVISGRMRRECPPGLGAAVGGLLRERGYGWRQRHRYRK